MGTGEGPGELQVIITDSPLNSMTLGNWIDNHHPRGKVEKRGTTEHTAQHLLIVVAARTSSRKKILLEADAQRGPEHTHSGKIMQINLQGFGRCDS